MKHVRKNRGNQPHPSSRRRQEVFLLITLRTGGAGLNGLECSSKLLNNSIYDDSCPVLKLCIIVVAAKDYLFVCHG